MGAGQPSRGGGSGRSCRELQRTTDPLFRQAGVSLDE